MHRNHDPAEAHVFGGKALPPAETAERARRILRGLTAAGGFNFDEPPRVEDSFLAEIHDVDYVAFLREAHVRWRKETGSSAEDGAVAYIRPIPGTPWRDPTSVLAQLGRYSNDVDPILEGTWDAAVASASCAVAAADAVSAGADFAYGLCRPPGHHAASATFGGYCYLNNAALAAQRLLKNTARVAVLDVDTHHGNGTQTIFWERPDVLTVSIHGDPSITYPFFLGHADETGGTGAEGSNLNLPLAQGSGWGFYRSALSQGLQAVTTFGAEALVLALGVDTHRDHGVLALAGDDFSKLGAAVATVGLPTVVVQEGGYSPGCLEEAVPAVLCGLAGG